MCKLFPCMQIYEIQSQGKCTFSENMLPTEVHTVEQVDLCMVIHFHRKPTNNLHVLKPDCLCMKNKKTVSFREESCF